MKIGFIGIGVMGRSMCIHLLGAGHKLNVFSRTHTARVDEVVTAGATLCSGVAEACRDAEAVFTMVSFPKDVEEVYFSSTGVLASVNRGTLVIDCTTTKPTLAERISQEALQKGIRFLDAPVSGGDVGARNATLSIMVGGCAEDFAAAQALFAVLGKTVVLQGPCGAGQRAKICNQIAIASGMIGVMETLLYCQKSGLKPETVLQSITVGAAASWSLANYVPRVLAGNMNPGFFVEHFLKDIEIALEECARVGVDAPGLRLAKELYLEVVALGGAKLGTQSIYLALEQRAKKLKQ